MRQNRTSGTLKELFCIIVYDINLQPDQNQQGQQTPMFKKIAFIHYCTQNLEQALEFYRDILGLKLLVKDKEWLEFDVGGQRLALHRVDLMPPRPEGPHPYGAMIWLEANPIEKSIASLKEKNINIINGIDILPYGKTTTFKDLDGNLIGLYEPPSKE